MPDYVCQRDVDEELCGREVGIGLDRTTTNTVGVGVGNVCDSFCLFVSSLDGRGGEARQR